MGREKVLVVSCHFSYPPSDGGQLRLHKLCGALSERYEFTIVTYGASNLSSPASRSLPYNLFVLSDLGRALKNPFTPTPLRRRLGSMLQVNVRVPMPVSHYFVYENVVRLVNDMVREKNIRLVEFENLYMIQYEEFIHANKRLLVLHDVESIRNKRAIDQQRLGIVDYGKARVQLGLLRGLERSLSQRCDWCVTVSDKERHIVEKWNPGLSVTTVPNAVDTSYFHPFEAEESNPVIVFSGTMRYLPNEIAATYLVREVLPLVQKVYPATKLVLLGKSPSENLKDLAAENPSVSVTDLVPDVRPYMSRNRIFVCPLWIGAGTRIKILEAMAMGMPVVTTRIGCEGLNVRDGASILLAENASEFAGKIELLISKPGEAERIGENGRRIAQECSWERSAEKQREVYEALLG